MVETDFISPIFRSLSYPAFYCRSAYSREIQREYVWSEEQIVKLFDSLIQVYPIGSFLFWVVETDKIGNFQFYEFIRNYHERDSRHNPKANIIGDKDITSILDLFSKFDLIYSARVEAAPYFKKLRKAFLLILWLENIQTII